MHFKHKEVGLSAIDPKDDTYRITTQTSIDELVDSIKDIGIINAPFVIRKSNGYSTVCGFRRIGDKRRCAGTGGAKTTTNISNFVKCQMILTARIIKKRS